MVVESKLRVFFVINGMTYLLLLSVCFQIIVPSRCEISGPDRMSKFFDTTMKEIGFNLLQEELTRNAQFTTTVKNGREILQAQYNQMKAYLEKAGQQIEHLKDFLEGDTFSKATPSDYSFCCSNKFPDSYMSYVLFQKVDVNDMCHTAPDHSIALYPSVGLKNFLLDSVAKFGKLTIQNIATVDGVNIRFPAIENYDGCNTYDPRLRNWFISAANLNYKRVVILLDISRLMYNKHFSSGEIFFEAAKMVVMNIAKGLSYKDYIAIIPFAGRDYDMTSADCVLDQLRSVTSKTLGNIQKLLTSLEPDSNETIAFRPPLQNAFNQLVMTRQDDSNQPVIVLISGSTVTEPLQDLMDAYQKFESVKWITKPVLITYYLKRKRTDFI